MSDIESSSQMVQTGARNLRLGPTQEEYTRFEAVSASEKLQQDSAKRPAYQYGIGLGSLVLAGMAYNFRKKGTKFSIPLYVIHTRLAVQGTVIGCLFTAMTFKLYDRWEKSKTSGV